MIRKFKAMGVVLVAVLSLSAVLAPVASAQFEAESSPAKLTISTNTTQKLTFSPGTQAIECTTAIYDSAEVNSVDPTTFRAIPTFFNCENFLGQHLGLDRNGCEYVFHLAKGSTTGTTDFECPEGWGMDFTVGSICKYRIDSQTNLGTITYKNTGAGTTRGIVMEISLTGITSTRTTNDFFCPAAGSEGTFTGTNTLTGENSTGTAHIGVFVD
jgi:hypothetical protein